MAAVYDVARLIDDLGDAAPGDRTALLTAFRADLATIWDGDREPETPVLRRLAPTVAACHLSHQPFDDLVRANLVDQTQTVYPTYADLEAYCELSANPVGRIVLEVFGASDPTNIALSDRICTALQVIEHCQDVAEDFRAGRTYMPQEDLHRYQVDENALRTAPARPELRRLLAFELRRAAEGLDAGRPLVRRLRGWARLAVAGYMAGGCAAIVSMRRAEFDVMTAVPAVRRSDMVRQLATVLARRRAAA